MFLILNSFAIPQRSDKTSLVTVWDRFELEVVAIWKKLSSAKAGDMSRRFSSGDIRITVPTSLYKPKILPLTPQAWFQFFLFLELQGVRVPIKFRSYLHPGIVFNLFSWGSTRVEQDIIPHISNGILMSLFGMYIECVATLGLGARWRGISSTIIP